MRNGKKKIALSLLFLCIVIIAYVIYCAVRTIPIPAPATIRRSVSLSSTSQIAWPATGQSAVAVVGDPTITTHGAQTPTPTASVAKLITSLVVLQSKPLSVGQQGPTITLTASDVALYDHYVAEQGSVVPVEAGETISEYQMLEAMLLPSANNMADSLAIWAFGSLSAYQQTANTWLSQHGLLETHIGVDASGYDPSTTSTAHDLVQLGELALQNPVIAQIVAEPSATGIPLTTTVRNVNSLLGSNGIIGIKTGNTNQAGGVFVSASQTSVSGQTQTIITAMAGTPTLADALSYSVPFIQSTHRNFVASNVITAGSTVANYPLPWGGSVPVSAYDTTALTVWSNSPVSLQVDLQALNNKASPGVIAGAVTAEQSSNLSTQAIQLHLAGPITQPTLKWRLLHPMNSKSGF